MPRYAVLIYWPEADQEMPGSPEFQKLAQSYAAFTDEVTKAGVMKASEGLRPTSTATTVRVRDGKTLTTDGPFAEAGGPLSVPLCYHRVTRVYRWARPHPTLSLQLRSVVAQRKRE